MKKGYTLLPFSSIPPELGAHRCVVLWLQPQQNTPIYFNWLILATVTLASTNNALPDDGLSAPKHVGSCFNVNIKIAFRKIHFCIRWWIEKNFDNKASSYQSFGETWCFLYQVADEIRSFVRNMVPTCQTVRCRPWITNHTRSCRCSGQSEYQHIHTNYFKFVHPVHFLYQCTPSLYQLNAYS